MPSEAAREHFEERAAIMEIDGGLSVEDAEVLALGDVAVAYGWDVAVNLIYFGVEDE
jgi:ketosteroid isomerase-like protein